MCSGLARGAANHPAHGAIDEPAGVGQRFPFDAPAEERAVAVAVGAIWTTAAVGAAVGAREGDGTHVVRDGEGEVAGIDDGVLDGGRVLAVYESLAQRERQPPELKVESRRWLSVVEYSRLWYGQREVVCAPSVYACGIGLCSLARYDGRELECAHRERLGAHVLITNNCRVQYSRNSG